MSKPPESLVQDNVFVITQVTPLRRGGRTGMKITRLVTSGPLEGQTFTEKIWSVEAPRKRLPFARTRNKGARKTKSPLGSA